MMPRLASPFVSSRMTIAAACALSLAALSGPVFAAPGAFALGSPANGGYVSATPTLRWGASSSATAYTLTVTPSGGAAIVRADLTATSYTVVAGEALSSAGSPFTWRVTARDAAGATIDSNTSSFFVDTSPPSDFGLTSPAADLFVRNQDARFSWEAATDAGSGLATYHFYVDGAPCGDA